jgi:hypothetical protein
MHGSVREGLENLLAAKSLATASEAASHISGCAECATEVDVMRAQSKLLKTLQSPGVLEPSGGFYARVLQRIEESAKRSIWWVFVYSPVGKRLAYASLAVAVVLGSYVVAAESSDGHLTAANIAFPDSHYDAPVVGSADEQRAAVLANFVAHPSVSEQPSPSQHPLVSE